MELLSSEIALAAAGFAGLAITTIAILRDVSAARSRTTSFLTVPAGSETVSSAT